MSNKLQDITIVNNIESINKTEWEQFVLEHADGNIFQTPEMYQVFLHTKGFTPVVAAAKHADKIVGVVLGVIIKEGNWLLKQLSARAIVFGGPLVKHSYEEILEPLLEAYNKLVKPFVIYSEIRNFFPTEETKKYFSNANYAYENHLNILLDITLDETSLLKRIKSQRRDGIRKAQKSGLIFEAITSPEIVTTFYNLLEISYKRIQLPYPQISLFQSLSANISNNGVIYFTLSQDGVPVIVLCALKYKHTLYAYYVGTTTDEAILKLRPVDMLYWEVLRWGKQNNIAIFDWMGAGKPDKEYGVRKFKLEYGGETIELGRYKYICKKPLYKFGAFGLEMKRKYFSKLGL